MIIFYVIVRQDMESRRPGERPYREQRLLFNRQPTLDEALKHSLTTADMRANFPDFNPDDYLAHDGLQIMKDSNKNLTLGSYFRKDGYTIIMGRTTLCQLEVE